MILALLVCTNGGVSLALPTPIPMDSILTAELLPENILPKAFAYIQDINANIMVELRYAGDDNFTGQPVDGYYLDSAAILITEAAEALSKAQVDAVSSATPRAGALAYTWDGTDSAGRAVSPGNYFVILEGTLRWENQVLYRAPITLGQRAAAVEIRGEYTGDLTAERAMISNVRVQVLR